jgi:hypothetical protein
MLLVLAPQTRSLTVQTRSLCRLISAKDCNNSPTPGAETGGFFPPGTPSLGARPSDGTHLPGRPRVDSRLLWTVSGDARKTTEAAHV